MLKIWKEKIDESGYIPGLYCNQSAYKFIQSCVDYDLTDMFEVWLAGGEQYYGEDVTIIEIMTGTEVESYSEYIINFNGIFYSSFPQ